MAGAVLSTMVTVAPQVLVLPFTSTTVRVTVFGPTLAQVKLLGETVLLAIPQASLELAVTSPAVIEAVPAGLRFTVMFWQTMAGAVLSTTVTVAPHVLVLPFTSTTVRVTGLAPTLAQVKLFGETVLLAMPQASLALAVTLAAVIEAVPPTLRFTV